MTQGPKGERSQRCNIKRPMASCSNQQMVRVFHPSLFCWSFGLAAGFTGFKTVAKVELLKLTIAWMIHQNAPRLLKPGAKRRSQPLIHLRQPIAELKANREPMHLLCWSGLLDRSDWHQSSFVSQVRIFSQNSIVEWFCIRRLDPRDSIANSVGRLQIEQLRQEKVREGTSVGHLISSWSFSG